MRIIKEEIIPIPDVLINSFNRDLNVFKVEKYQYKRWYLICNFSGILSLNNH